MLHYSWGLIIIGLKAPLLKHLVYFGLFIALLLGSEFSFAQTATFSVKPNAGVTSGPLYYSQTAIVLYGFNLKFSAPTPTLNAFHLTSISAGNGYFTNGKLYAIKGSNGNFSAATQVAAATVTFTATGVDITGLTETFTAAGTLNTYFLVADFTVNTGTMPANIQFGLSTTQAAVSSTGVKFGDAGNDAGNVLTLSQPVLAVANNIAGLTATTLTPGQTGIAMFGFALTITGQSTVKTININSNNSNLPGYFANGKLYRGAGSTFDPASPGTQVGTVTFTGGNVSVTGLSEAFTYSATGQTNYYYLVADYSVYTGTTPSSVIFNFTSSPTEIVTTVPTTNPSATVNYSGITTSNTRSYIIDGKSVTLTNVTGSLAGNNLVPGQTAMVLFEYKVTVKGVATFSQFNIVSSNTNLQGYLGNGKLYRSTVKAYDATAVQIAGSGVSGTSVVFNGGYVNVTGLSESYSTSSTTGQSYFYFLVADYSVYTNQPTTANFGFTTTQSPAAIIQSSPSSASLNPNAINNKTFNLGNVVNLTANNPAGATLVSGQTNIAMFGFKAGLRGIGTLTQINIGSNNANLSTYFTNGKFYRSTKATYDATATQIAGSAVSGTAVTFSGSIVKITGLSESFNSSTSVKLYYYFVADYYYTGSTSDYVIFNFTNGQTLPAVVQNTPYPYNYNKYTFSESTYIIGSPQTNDWIGAISTDWNTAGNWSTGHVPQTIDAARFGVLSAFTYQPAVSANTTVGSVVIGNKGGSSVRLTINTGFTLAIKSDITSQSDASSSLNYNHQLLGGGSISANNLNVISNTSLAASYTETLSSFLGNLTISNLNLTSTTNTVNFNAVFNVSGGVTNLSGLVNTYNGTGSTAALNVAGGTLQIPADDPLSGLSANGTNIVSFANAGSTVEYSGADQGVYTDATIPNLAAGGVNYQSIKFSGTGVKIPASGNLNIAGDFTNIMANDAANFVDLNAVSTNFTGAATQTLYGGGGAGTVLYAVNVSGASTKNMLTGNFYIASSGVLTMTGTNTTILNSSSNLTFVSDLNGTGTVAALNGPQITGLVNVQRYVSGGSGFRGYRLLSSAVSTSANSGIYSLNFVKNSAYITGTGGTTNGFDAAGNPTIYLFREDMVPSNATFTSGNFRGVSNIATTPNYSIDGGSSGVTVPSGNGFLFFFRGDKNIAPLSAETTPTYIPTATVFTQTGALNQGQITVKPWYSSTSVNLGYSSTAGDATVSGFNLVGNPYPSSIDWDTYNTTTSTSGIYAPNVSPFMYTLDPVTRNYNVYQNGSGGFGTIGNSNSNVIASGQGFFVVASSASAQLIFNESAKTNSQVSNGDRNLFLSTAAVKADVKQFLHFKLMKDSSNIDGMLIGFKRGAKETFATEEDAPYKTGNGKMSISSLSDDNVPLAINTFGFPGKNKVIKLFIGGSTDGTYQLKLAKMKSIPDLYQVWLKDAYRKDSLDLKHNPVYSFDVIKTDTATYGGKRFSLVIRQDPLLGMRLLSFAASKISTGSQIIWKTENEQNYTNFAVERSIDNGATFNVIGGFASSARGTYSFIDEKPVTTVSNQYRLKLEDINGTITYSAIVIIQYANSSNNIAKNGFNVYPNPAVGIINLSINQTIAAAYSIQIMNNLGTIIRTATSDTPSWQGDVSKLAPGTYIIKVMNTTSKTQVGKGTFVKL